jgi:hypothetical protein
MTNVTPPSSSSSNTLYGIKKSHNWLRVAQVGLGAISIILSIIVLTFPGVAIYSIIVPLSKDKVVAEKLITKEERFKE